MTIARTTLLETIFVVVFSFVLSTSAIKTFSLLSGIDIPIVIYLGAGALSVLTFSVFAYMWSKMRAMVRGAA